MILRIGLMPTAISLSRILSNSLRSRSADFECIIGSIAENIMGIPQKSHGRVSRDFLVYALFKNNIAIFLQCKQKNHAEDSAGKDFARTDREHKKRDSAGKSVGIGQNKRNDNGIG